MLPSPLRPALASWALLAVLLAVLPTRSLLMAQKSASERVDPVRAELLKINYVFNRKLYSLAIPEYERLLKEHPGFEDVAVVHYALALCHYNLATTESPPDKATDAETTNLRSAILHLKEALRSRRFESRAEATNLLGQCLLQVDDHRNAAVAFRWVLEKTESEQLKSAATLGLAEALYLQGDYGEATLEYGKFLEQTNVSAGNRNRARFYLAMALYNGRSAANVRSASTGPTRPPTAQALALFEELAGAPDDPYRDDALYMAALIYAEEGHHAEAAPRFDRLVQSGSKVYAERALFGLASSYFQMRDYESAEKALRRFAKAFPGSERLDEALLLDARARLELGRRDLAIESLRRLRTSVVVGDQASLILARKLAETGRQDEAEMVTREALKAFPESPLREDLEMELALSELAGERFEPAAETLKAFRERHSDSRSSDQAAYLLAYALHRAGQPAESLAVCRDFRQRYPESDYLADVLELEAESGFRIGKFAAAKEAYEAYLDRAGSRLDETASARTRLRIAQALHQEHKYEEALGVLSKIHPPAPADDVLLLSYHYYVGECCYQLEKYERAASELSTYLEQLSAARGASREAIELQTRDAQFKLGHSLQLAGRASDARKAYRSALESDPRTPHAEQILFELGQLAYAEDDFEGASRQLGSLVEKHPDSRFVPHALYYLGSIAYDAGNYEGAVGYFDRIVKDHAQSAVATDAEYELAMSLLAAGHPERAEAVRKRFQQNHPDDPRFGSILLEEAVAASNAGHFEDALAILTKLDGDGSAAVERSRVLYEMAWCHRRLGRPDQAVEVYERLLRSMADRSSDSPAPAPEFENAVRLELAELEFDRENYARAKVLLTPLAATASGATLESALYRLCWCHHELEEKEPTVDVFRRFEKAFPRSELYPELAMLAARALLEQKKPGPAGDLFKVIATGFPEEKSADLALVSYGECRLEERRFTEAKTIFQDAIARFPGSDIAYRAHFGLGWANENLGLREEAMNHYRRVIAATSTPTAARAQFQIGQCLVATKDYPRAIVEFLKVPASYRYDDWSAKALLQIAGCFEALEDRQKARKYYEEVVTLYERREEGKLARERLRKLEID